MIAITTTIATARCIVRRRLLTTGRSGLLTALRGRLPSHPVSTVMPRLLRLVVLRRLHARPATTAIALPVVWLPCPRVRLTLRRLHARQAATTIALPIVGLPAIPVSPVVGAAAIAVAPVTVAPVTITMITITAVPIVTIPTAIIPIPTVAISVIPIAVIAIPIIPTAAIPIAMVPIAAMLAIPTTAPIIADAEAVTLIELEA